jgi:hypothetical protein
MKTTPNKSNPEAVPSKPVDAAPLTLPPRRSRHAREAWSQSRNRDHADAHTYLSAAEDAATSLWLCLLTICRTPSTHIGPVNLEEIFVSFEEKENALFTRTYNESSLDLMRRCTRSQAAKLPSCQAKSLRKLVSSGSNKNPSPTGESPFNIGVAPGFFPTVGASESTGELRGYHQ